LKWIWSGFEVVLKRIWLLCFMLRDSILMTRGSRALGLALPHFAALNKQTNRFWFHPNFHHWK
jgi:hypothetical protein